MFSMLLVQIVVKYFPPCPPPSPHDLYSSIVLLPLLTTQLLRPSEANDTACKWQERLIYLCLLLTGKGGEEGLWNCLGGLLLVVWFFVSHRGVLRVISMTT